jgi:hypothetical protein
MEFAVPYNCLKNYHLVWKYYLTKLIKDRDNNGNIKPYFTIEIENPVKFWHELKISFMSSFDP